MVKMVAFAIFFAATQLAASIDQKTSLTRQESKQAHILMDDDGKLTQAVSIDGDAQFKSHRALLTKRTGRNGCPQAECESCDECMKNAADSTACSNAVSNGVCVDPKSKNKDADKKAGEEDKCGDALYACGSEDCVDEVLCNSACVCDDWKNDKCDGATVPYDATGCIRSFRPGNGNGGSLLQEKVNASGKTDLAERSSLDASLQDKCTGR